MKKFLITGACSGLGKYLFQNIDCASGLNRENFEQIANTKYDYIIHCAFNKENLVSDYKKYLEDNIFLTQRLKQFDCKKFVYISSIDIYSNNTNLYTTFKKFAETLLDENDLILRCSAMIGPNMKSNHLVKLRDNADKITLSENSTFNYILYSDILNFVKQNTLQDQNGIIDFVSNETISIREVANLFGSQTKFGDFEYRSDLQFTNPIYNLNTEYNKSSLDVLREYYGI